MPGSSVDAGDNARGQGQALSGDRGQGTTLPYRGERLSRSPSEPARAAPYQRWRRWARHRPCRMYRLAARNLSPPPMQRLPRTQGWQVTRRANQ